MALLEFEGKNLEEAMKAAAAALGLPAERLRFTIASLGGSGFLGLGRKKARIYIDSNKKTNDADQDTGEPDAAMRLAEEIAGGILRRMGFSPEIAVERVSDRIIIKVAKSCDNALLIGSRGSTLWALEFLAGLIFSKRLKESAGPEAQDLQLLIDVDNYRARRP